MAAGAAFFGTLISGGFFDLWCRHGVRTRRKPQVLDGNENPPCQRRMSGGGV
jgi:hypothetical protein